MSTLRHRVSRWRDGVQLPAWDKRPGSVAKERRWRDGDVAADTSKNNAFLDWQSMSSFQPRVNRKRATAPVVDDDGDDEPASYTKRQRFDGQMVELKDLCSTPSRSSLSPLKYGTQFGMVGSGGRQIDLRALRPQNDFQTLQIKVALMYTILDYKFYNNSDPPATPDDASYLRQVYDLENDHMEQWKGEGEVPQLLSLNTPWLGIFDCVPAAQMTEATLSQIFEDSCGETVGGFDTDSQGIIVDGCQAKEDATSHIAEGDAQVLEIPSSMVLTTSVKAVQDLDDLFMEVSGKAATDSVVIESSNDTALSELSASDSCDTTVENRESGVSVTADEFDDMMQHLDYEILDSFTGWENFVYDDHDMEDL